jgi:hemerythrin superfamily protein
MSTDVGAVEFLEEQHREVEKLFAQLDKADGPSSKGKIFRQIADKLAVHATIEERHFYPAVRAKRTEDILLESLEEHLGIKRVIADLMGVRPDDKTFDAKAKVLKEQVEHHVKEEETDLFPKVKKIMDRDMLVAITQEMLATQEELLAKGNPREAVPAETIEAHSLR